MRGSWTDQEMNSIPHEGKWCCVHEEGRSQATEVVEMLHWVHGESFDNKEGEMKGLTRLTCKGFNVSVPMMKAVDIFVHG